MSHLPPGGPQPLQTYLGSAVRAPVPAPAAAAVVATPTPAVASPATQPIAAAAAPPAAGDVFATPALFGGADTGSVVADSHLSSLLGATSSDARSLFADANEPSQQSQPLPTSTSFTTPTHSASPGLKLEQTMDHPLLGGSPPPFVSATPAQQPSSAADPGFAPSRSPTAVPARMTRVNSTGPLAPASNPLSAATQEFTQGRVVAAGPLDGPISPKEQLSTLLAQLFQGPPPPAKLAVFDVSAQPRTEAGAIILAEHGCWREVVKLCETLLDAKQSPALEPERSYRVVHLLISALLKLHKYDQAQAVLQQRVGNSFSSDKLFSSHPTFYPPGPEQRPGNMLPFELHLLATEMPHYGGKTRQALDQQMKLLQFIRAQMTRKKAEQSGSAATSDPPVPLEKRGSLADSSSPPPTHNPFSVHSPHTLTSLTLSQLQAQLTILRLHIVNMCLAFTNPLDIDYAQAMLWLQEVIEDEPQNPTHLESMARMHLQMGDLHQADQCLARAKAIYETRGEKDHMQIGLHHVLMCLSRNDYVAAHAAAQVLYAAHPLNVEVANNLAVCCLYVNRASEAITALEALIRADPIANLHESVLSNLRALYDLGSSDPALKRRMLEGLEIMYGETA